jgi:hypothetical protein
VREEAKPSGPLGPPIPRHRPVDGQDMKLSSRDRGTGLLVDQLTWTDVVAAERPVEIASTTAAAAASTKPQRTCPIPQDRTSTDGAAVGPDEDQQTESDGQMRCLRVGDSRCRELIPISKAESGSSAGLRARVGCPPVQLRRRLTMSPPSSVAKHSRGGGARNRGEAVRVWNVSHIPGCAIERTGVPHAPRGPDPLAA